MQMRINLLTHFYTGLNFNNFPNKPETRSLGRLVDWIWLGFGGAGHLFLNVCECEKYAQECVLYTKLKLVLCTYLLINIQGLVRRLLGNYLLLRI